MNPKQYAVVVKRQGEYTESHIVADVVADAATNTLKLYGVRVQGGVGRLNFNMRYVEYYSVVEVQQ